MGDRVSSSPLGRVVPSFQPLSGRLKFAVRRHKFNDDSLSCARLPTRKTLRPSSVRTGSWMGPPQGKRAPRACPIRTRSSHPVAAAEQEENNVNGFHLKTATAIIETRLLLAYSVPNRSTADMAVQGLPNSATLEIPGVPGNSKLSVPRFRVKGLGFGV